MIRTGMILASATAFTLGVVSSCTAQQSPPPGCQAVVPIDSETTLAQLSGFWFGDPAFQYAILLASNARVGQDGIGFISDINALNAGDNVCIPDANEADRLRRRYDRYGEAVEDASLAEPYEVVNSLDPLPQSGSYTVTSWIRSDQVSNYPDAPGLYTVPGATWVTLDPHLADFCTAYRSEVSEEIGALTLRLEQRLGLPPSSSKTHFVRFALSPSQGGDAIFRPCGDSATNTNTCSVGFPSTDCTDEACRKHRAFFLGQYYSAFGTALPVQYPWTSLGYTFDWGQGTHNADGTIAFQEVGESEYVIPANTEVQFVEIVTTEQFCSGGTQ